MVSLLLIIGLGVCPAPLRQTLFCTLIISPQSTSRRFYSHVTASFAHPLRQSAHHEQAAADAKHEQDAPARDQRISPPGHGALQLTKRALGSENDPSAVFNRSLNNAYVFPQGREFHPPFCAIANPRFHRFRIGPWQSLHR